MKRYCLIIVFFINSIFFGPKAIAQFGTIYNIAGDANPGYGTDGYGDGCHKDSAWFNNPQGIYVDKNQNVYIVDGSHYIIRKFTAATGIVNIIAGTGINGFSGDDSSALLAKIGYCTGICLDTVGNIYITDATNNRVRMIDIATGKITTVAGNGTGGYGGDGGPATSANINYPKSLRIDTAGNMYIIDGGGSRIRKVILATGVISTIAGNGTHGYSGDGGSALSAAINYPFDIAIDKNGNIYFTDQSNNRVRKVNPSGIISTIAGTGHAGYSGDGEAGTLAMTNYPQSIGVDSLNNVYFADQSNRIVRKIDVATGIITTVAGTTINPLAYGDLWTMGQSSDSNNLNANCIFVDRAADIYYSTTRAIRKIVEPASAIATLHTTDSILSASCSLPQTLSVGVYGTIVGMPGTADSIKISIDYGEFSGNSVKNYILPYWYTSVYGFGDTVTRFSKHTYRIPGIYSPVITLHTIGGFADATTLPIVTVSSICDSSVTGIYIDSSKDSVMTLPCTFPAKVRFNVWGTIDGTPSTGDSVYLAYKYNYDDTVFNLHIVPIISVGTEYHFKDSFYHYFNSGQYSPQVMAVVSSGQHNSVDYFSGINIDTCSSGGITNNISDTAVVFATCSLPYTDRYQISGKLSGAATSLDSVLIYANFKDGKDTLFKVPVITDGHGTFSYQSAYFTHTFTSAGSYRVADSVSCGTYNAISISNTLVLGGSANIDMALAGWGWGFTPGDTGTIGIWGGNFSAHLCDTVSSRITLTLDPLLTYAGMKDGTAPTTISGNTLLWSFKAPVSPIKFYATVKVVCSSSASLPGILCNVLHIDSTTVADPDTTNNTYSWCDSIRSSWPLNQKLVSPVGDTPARYIPIGTPMNYIIRFTNNYATKIRKIIITDTLSYFLNASSVQVISSRFPVVLAHPRYNVISFTFNNINLPDSMDNPDSCTGYVAFQVLPVSSIYKGAQITNYASIYMDTIPVIYTDTTLNTVGKYTPIHVPTINAPKVSVYPNPFTDEITITSTEKIRTVSLLNVVGQKVYSHAFNTERVVVHIKDVVPGVYFIKVNDRYVQKILKE